MPSCLSALRAVLASLALFGPMLFLPVHATAQDVLPQGAAAPSTSLELFQELPPPADEDAAVREGFDLERAHRWVDAIGHYEKALERFPENQRLEYGLRRSKIHFGIDRRYSDASYEQQLLRKSPSDSLALFDEIYDQVKNTYVDPVSVTSFTAHGTESLYLALANEKFLARNLPQARPETVAQVRQILRENYWNRNVEGGQKARETIREVCELTHARLGLGETPVVMEYVFGGCNSLDDYSNFLTPDRLGDLYGNIEGEFVGLGIEMQAENGRGMLLVNVLPDSPAAAGGMHAGEYIVSIDGTDCRKMTTDEAAKLLRGPTGSAVELELLAATDDRPRRGQFVRRPVIVKSIESVQMLDPSAGVGYLRMTGFQKTTAEELDAALVTLKRQGMKKLVWDLRGNPGGLLTAAVEVLDRFIADGVLVTTRGRSFDQNWTYSAHRSGTHSDVEIVLLVDGDSASASEIVAGAIRDHKRGVIVGRTTYGKWSVQSILPIRDKTGLRLTTAKFYSPDNHTYGKIGMKPDVAVEEVDQVIAGYRAGDLKELMSQADIQAALNAFDDQNHAVTSR
ncbi:MAG: S41 family peptidase [Planctomycetaceae bacterium]